jgi:hypothetical protein
MAIARRVGGVAVNDGKGLFDSDGLIDSLIVDINDITKLLVSGQYIAYCNKIGAVAQKLVTLKNGVKNDISSRDKQIAELNDIISKINEEKAGDVNE